MNRIHRNILHTSAIGAAFMVFGWAGQAAAQGYFEINQAIFDASGGLPYVIDQPGNYRLTGNLDRPNTSVNQPLIRIEADGVNLDLNGYTISGTGACSRNASTGQVTCAGHQPGSGIQSSGFDDVVIRNGWVSGFFNGIVVTGSNIRIESITSSNNAFDGIQSFADNTTVLRSTSLRNGQNGITVSNNSVISNCNASQNDDYGISANLASVVNYSTAMGNRLGGMTLNSQATYSQNSVIDNFGPDPVFSGRDGGGNICTNAIGSPVTC